MLMLKRTWVILMWLLVASVWAQPPGVTFVQDGIEVDAASVGRFVLAFPKLFDETQQVESKLIERDVSAARAVLSYTGGAKLELAAEAASGKVSIVFAGTRTDAVKFLVLEMLVPINFNQGGTWKLGGTAGEFPVKKPATPHLFQGNVETFSVANFEGRSLVVRPPAYSFQQLTDNREWHWPTFFWKSITPLDAHADGMTLTFALEGGSAKGKPLVDALGQSTRSEWPAKVSALTQLQADVEEEKAYFAALQAPARDAFGGLPGSGEALGLQATGFFHVEQKHGRWYLVDPDGNAFFHVGVCGFNPNDDYTLIKGRENTYEWLPESRGEFASAFRPGSDGTIVSFHLVNQIRKYGRPFEANAYAERMIERLRKWGFTSVGAFTDLGFGAEARKKAKFPGVAHLPINSWEKVPRVPGIHETFDPFDDATRKQIAGNMAAALPQHANDPLIIGYYIVNEPIYEQIPVIVPSLKGSAHACKRRFVAWLKEKYSAISAFNLAWQMQAQGFDELLEQGLPLGADAAKADATAFAELFLDAYLTLVKEEFRRHDRQHLLIGSRLQPGTIQHEWICRVLGRHVDVMSFNYYTYGVDRAFLSKIHQWTGDRPMLLSEFFWSSPADSGLTGGREVSSQRERGLAYRHYVEQAASLGFVIGIEWFTLVDQSVTGRWFSGFDGERSNSGLMAVTDRPWKEMLEEVVKTNRDIHGVWTGKRAPFRWDDPRFAVPPPR